ncbi:MAG: phosphotransferase [Chitinivibrionales bacterium]|nr:phosphotransferase [Chitinivibrionales bacterium]MBD3395442.1 phosphotransferase [Chitinivibrionales bacterium]
MAERYALSSGHASFLCRAITGFEPEKWNAEMAGSAGSDRTFVRLRENDGERTFVLIVWDSADNDWRRFIRISEEVAGAATVLPSIIATDAEHGLILEEDLGSVQLRDMASAARTRDEMAGVYEPVIDALAGWHAIEVPQHSVIAERSMDVDMFLWESRYFAEHCAREFLGRADVLDARWEDDRFRLASEAAKLPHVCMHRDFQSENVMLTGSQIRFVDFQGARLGPAEYDLASLLYDPYVASLDTGLVDHLHACYVRRSERAISRRGLHIAAVQRLLQALGAFCNLSLHKGKDRYRRFVPIALERLQGVLGCMEDFAAIRSVTDQCRCALFG